MPIANFLQFIRFEKYFEYNSLILSSKPYRFSRKSILIEYKDNSSVNLSNRIQMPCKIFSKKK
jgi:hypothetical protein